VTKERWSTNLRRNIPSHPAIEAFLDEYEALCRKHGMALGHEDEHGAFQIEDYVESCVDWARQAFDTLTPAEPAPVPIVGVDVCGTKHFDNRFALFQPCVLLLGHDGPHRALECPWGPLAPLVATKGEP